MPLPIASYWFGFGNRFDLRTASQTMRSVSERSFQSLGRCRDERSYALDGAFPREVQLLKSEA